ncbi:MAG: hypothetical protein LBC80_05320, partial [Treponema sp.]|nr:hypothetical protein [Treponema sp.]
MNNQTFSLEQLAGSNKKRINPWFVVFVWFVVIFFVVPVVTEAQADPFPGMAVQGTMDILAPPP